MAALSFFGTFNPVGETSQKVRHVTMASGTVTNKRISYEVIASDLKIGYAYISFVGIQSLNKIL